MVTFSLPGDDVVESANALHRSRPPLPFAKRNNTTASTFGHSSAKRLGTPHASSTRKLSTPFDEAAPPSSLTRSSIATARNIFRASTMSGSPDSPFSPNTSTSTMTKVFAPGATPEPSRVYRESVAQATPRGMAAKTTTKELFPMRIASPPPELTGEALTQKIPREWNSKGSIYADQFLSHLCPPELDEEQRRQFFCILDLRRLKYAANEIFARKDWKLNVMNFAKEFEKSRSIILLRYGLYEFQNVKPSKDVLKRWRREHGLPEPEDEEDQMTPTRATTSKKRKATDDDAAENSAATGKRRAMEKPAETEHPLASHLQPSNTKRKASVSEEQPAKLQKSAPSPAKALFEKIANKPAPNKPVEQPMATTKTNPFTANKPSTSSNLARSVFTSHRPVASPATGGNTFNYASDASSAKNSGVDADAESESESEQDDSQVAGPGDEPLATASGPGDTDSPFGPKSFLPQAASLTGSSGVGLSGAPGTRESTPGRSLFDRVTKGTDGQPVRIEEAPQATEPGAKAILQTASQAESRQESPAASDQTWNPSTTPIKFAPTSNPDPVGSSHSIADGRINEAKKDGGESDKENESSPGKNGLFETKAPTAQPLFGSSLLAPKPATTESPKPAFGLFGNATAPPPKTGFQPAQASGPATSLFGQANKPAGTTPSSIFATKSTETDKASNEAPKPTSLFAKTTTSATPAVSSAGSLFGVKPASNAGTLFGSSSSTPAKQPPFGATFSAPTDSTTTKVDTPKPMFKLGDKDDTAPPAGASKPLFGAPKSPPSTTAAGNLFGSPMKQDDSSPAKTAASNIDGAAAGGSTSLFKFGGANPLAVPTSTMFGASSAPQQSSTTASTGPINFGGQSTGAASGSGGFNFNFGGASTAPNDSFKNPFAPSNTGLNQPIASAAPPSGGLFAFGAGSTAPAGTSKPFQFSGNAPAPNSNTNTPAPLFGGGASGTGSAPSFNFTAGGAAPQGTGSVFGSNQAAPAFNLQPPAGGSTTTGTNSPVNFGGGSSLATTPAAGTPEPSVHSDAVRNGDTKDDDSEKHEQISLTDAVDEEEEVLHEVRAKVLKFVPASQKSDKADKADDQAKAKSPWSTQGVGHLRLLKNKETGLVRLLLRAEPRGHVALNRALLSKMSYEADEKYVKLMTSNDSGDGLETWMVQVKTKDSAKELADALEKNKDANTM